MERARPIPGWERDRVSGGEKVKEVGHFTGEGSGGCEAEG